VIAPDDSNVFGKAGTSGHDFEVALAGKKVVSAGNQGKYFWLILDKPPHPVMHFGMTGWVHINGVKTAYTNYYNKMKAEEKDLWPPKYWKFQLETEGNPKVEVAFTDPRRFGRVRLVDCPGENIRKVSPLVENGPDPVVDPDVFTEDFLLAKMRSRHVPVKALLLDQTSISGIGNWVGDEVLFQARLHPEQYCDDFDDAQAKKLFKAICHVCQIAVDKLGDSDQFPEDWLFHYRWGKGAKGSATMMPGGEKLAFLTVGGRTSCYAPNLQKKTGRVVSGAKEEPVPKEDKRSMSEVTKTGASEQPPKKRKRVEAKLDETDKGSRRAKNNTEREKAGAETSRQAQSRDTRPGAMADQNRRRSGRLQGK